MGIWDTITDLVEAATPWTTADAEAPAQEEQQEETAETKEDESEKAEEATEEPAEEEEAEAEAEEDDEEEEDEEEIVDPKEKFEEECRESKQCAPAKHHFDECVDRVTNASSSDGPKEDCVEEFFHLAHCATQCAAPKLWSVLK
ncbi:ubiquinol-cytochrome C reductase hinge protein-domain-containing protein [Lasiosphaeria miniovina]|uniref:Cytochrome b-c1 complex subunit 6, mitochondrial n=1 Tax=Lasiosphaeria miniovina TaxID=1954250 RepID=A0AA40DRV5_9PEZI|nr:ubiquinol-cytochrome C reductase hinge protein-domain-containing protein [Lasiosphaeria miniovina]KAK0709683.1 ubiquinol-cytochrome C reductase hinge protein-domain-containing protein [Lasiosphaeria miniovina]